MKYINTEKTVIKSWCNNPEDGAIEQAKNIANLPFIYKQVCLMPDTHQGYGMPIGGVIACENVVIPNAVGVDIGCGMCAVKTSITDIDVDTLKNIMGEIRKVIPVGFNKHISSQPEFHDFESSLLIDNIPKICLNNWDSASKSIGTLGGGNHFIEIQKDEEGYVWIMVHSGSRNLGKQVADYYNDVAKKLNHKWYSSVPKEYDLAFLPTDIQEAVDYINEMQYCVEFALFNRELMIKRIKESFNKYIDCFFEPIINIAHNYARLENHFGKNVWIHRKGATSAKLDELGIIPGSQGTSSYIVKGLGNTESFMSCSHGAGRKIGRKEAQRTLNLEGEINMLNSKGIIHSIRVVGDLDEAPSAYKDIDLVMEEQKDLVDIVVKLEPSAVIKG